MKADTKFILEMFLSIGIIIWMVTIVSAQEIIYVGGCYNLTFPNSEPVNIQILEGDLEGFNWIQNNTIITYCLSADFKPQTFRVRWFNDGYEDVVKEVRVGGGGGTRTIIKNQTNIVEVPTFLDRNITTEIIKEVPSEPIIKKEIPLWIWISIGVLTILVIIFFKLYTDKKEVL